MTQKKDNAEELNWKEIFGPPSGCHRIGRRSSTRAAASLVASFVAGVSMTKRWRGPWLSAPRITSHDARTVKWLPSLRRWVWA
jgi:hypothetical protein